MKELDAENFTILSIIHLEKMLKSICFVKNNTIQKQYFTEGWYCYKTNEMIAF